ncbi:MAG: XRE family transcriptional regulator [Pseudomonadota bacterium]
MPSVPSRLKKTRRSEKKSVAPDITSPDIANKDTADQDVSSADRAQIQLGQRVRALRKAAGLTLETASQETGLSRASLSKIERGEMSPTYDSLYKLAQGLKLDLAALVSGQAPVAGGIAVTRAGAGARQETAQFRHHLLAPDFADRHLYVFETEVKGTELPKPRSWDRHNSEDFLYVRSGVIAVHMKGHDPITLRKGDSLQMDGRIPHALVTLHRSGVKESKAGTRRKGSDDNAPKAATPAKILWISVPYDR